MTKVIRVILILIICSLNSYAQSFSDLSNINFSELNEGQLDLLLRRATAQGFNEFDLLKMAKLIPCQENKV